MPWTVFIENPSGHSLSLLRAVCCLYLSHPTDFLMYDNVVNKSWKKFLLAAAAAASPIPFRARPNQSQRQARPPPVLLSSSLAFQRVRP